MKQESNTCKNCWAAAGTRRYTADRTVKRLCRKSGLMVVVTQRGVGSCEAWQPRPANSDIAKRANSDANHRISGIKEEKL